MPDEGQRPLLFYQAISSIEDTSYLLSRQLKIVRVNAAWTRFAEQNGGAEVLLRWGRGSAVLDAISADLRDMFRHMYMHALASNERCEHDYDCDSNDVKRPLRMLAIPLDGQFIVVTHSRRILAADAIEDAYVHDGVVTMCASCRRVRALDGERWDAVPEALVGKSQRISHGLCRLCALVSPSS